VGFSCYMGFRRIHEMKHSYDMSRPPSTTPFGCHEIKLHCVKLDIFNQLYKNKQHDLKIKHKINQIIH
jgi:hypothetical protein